MRQRRRCPEQVDEIDRRSGTPQVGRPRHMRPVTGRFLALIAAAAPRVDTVVVPVGKGLCFCRKL